VEVAIASGNYALALGGAGRHAEAETAARDAVDMSGVVFGADHPRTAVARMRLAEVLIATDRPAEAEPLLRDAITALTAVGERYAATGAARARLGEALLALGRDAEGIRELEEGWAILMETMSPGTPATRRIAARAAAYHEANNDTALARTWRTRAEGEG
jgi:predicted Zn-dependent protease